MQKILVLILVICSSGLIFFSYQNIIYAACSNDVSSKDYCNEADKASDAASNSNTPSSPNKIFTSESVPGADCVCAPDAVCDGNEVAKRKYICTVPTGLAGFQSVFAKLIRFVINIVLLLGVLSVVGLGIAWSFAWGDDVKAKSSLKKWAINIIIGLAILFFFRYILLFLAPWVYQ